MAILISSPGVNLIFVNTCLTNRIMKKLNSSPSRLAALLGVACSVACGFLSAQAQVTATYTPANWTNDPYTSGLDPYYTLNTASANTAAPLFMLNSTSSEGSGLYGYSPIGATITLASPNQTAILTGTVTFLGASEAPGNNQFRYGLLYRGAQTADTGWMGYASGSPGTTTTTQPALSPSAVTVRVENGVDFTQPVASETAAALERQGFTVDGIANAPTDTVTTTEVEYAEGHQAAGEAVAARLSGATVVAADPDLAGDQVTVVVGKSFTGVKAAPSSTGSATATATTGAGTTGATSSGATSAGATSSGATTTTTTPPGLVHNNTQPEPWDPTPCTLGG